MLRIFLGAGGEVKTLPTKVFMQLELFALVPLFPNLLDGNWSQTLPFLLDSSSSQIDCSVHLASSTR